MSKGGGFFCTLCKATLQDLVPLDITGCSAATTLRPVCTGWEAVQIGGIRAKCNANIRREIVDFWMTL